MLSPDTTEGAFVSVLPPRPGMTKASADQLIPIIVVPAVATIMTMIVANKKTFAAVTLDSFFLPFLRCFISLPSTDIVDKRIPLLLIGQVTQRKIPKRRDPVSSFSTNIYVDVFSQSQSNDILLSKVKIYLFMITLGR